MLGVVGSESHQRSVQDVQHQPVAVCDRQRHFADKCVPFAAVQIPRLIATYIDACDINVSPDKRTIFLHSENNLVQALKVCPCIGHWKRHSSSRAPTDCTRNRVFVRTVHV